MIVHNGKDSPAACEKVSLCTMISQNRGSAWALCAQNTRSGWRVDLIPPKRPCISVKNRNEAAKKFRNARLGSVGRGVSRFWGKTERTGCRPPSPMVPRKGALFEGSLKPLSCWRSEARHHCSSGQPCSRLPNMKPPPAGDDAGGGKEGCPTNRALFRG